MKIKLRLSDLNLYIFNIVIAVYVLTIQYESVGLISQLKYIVCVLGMAYSFYVMFRQNTKHLYMQKETLCLIVVPVLFFVISIFKIINVHHFTPRIVAELAFMIIPILYSYAIINTLSFKQIDKAIFNTLIISFAGYILSLGMNPLEFIGAFSTISFRNSYSLFESSQFSGISIAIALYYLYYRKNKIALFLSLLFVFLTFKRLAVLVAIILLFLPKVINMTKPITNKTLNFIVFGVFTVSVAYFQLMIPENYQMVREIIGNNVNKFTMGRYWRFSLLYNNPFYVNYGLGSTFDFLMNIYKFALEMDICKLIIEIGYAGVFVFIYNFFWVVKRNLYCTVIMGYMFLNMITSHSLASMFMWVIFYITLGTIEYINPDGVKPFAKIDKTMFLTKKEMKV